MILRKSRLRGLPGLHARGDRGATAVEYALMVSLIALVIILGVMAFGLSVNGLFELAVETPPFD